MPETTTEHSYYDWQVSTLMLAYDAMDPLHRDDDEALAKRDEDVRAELVQLVQAVLPRQYLDNPSADFPPEMVMLLTRATVARAAQILALV
jgi:hypothetical protein